MVDMPSATPEKAEKSDRHTSLTQLVQNLQAAHALRQTAAQDPVLAARRQRLRDFQSQRLAHTHSDLLASPLFAQAARFFLSDLYGPMDARGRDAELARVVPTLTRLLPTSGVRTLLLATELDALSERLDAAMVHALGASLDAPLTEAAYARAYRQVSSTAERQHQIDLIDATGNTLDSLARVPLLHATLKAMHKPAQAAGLGDLQAFLERGFDAFRSMGKSSKVFLDTIRQREMQFSQALFAGADNWRTHGGGNPTYSV